MTLQAPLSIGFSRQEYWGGSPCPPPGDLPNSGFESTSLKAPALAGVFSTISVLGKPSGGANGRYNEILSLSFYFKHSSKTRSSELRVVYYMTCWELFIYFKFIEYFGDL